MQVGLNRFTVIEYYTDESIAILTSDIPRLALDFQAEAKLICDYDYQRR
jgi:hypothetical protein